MPSLPKFTLLVALVAVTALLALPAAAQATLAYVKNPMNPAVYAANDNGSGAFKVGFGTNPQVSPDGDVIAYSREGTGGKRGTDAGAAAGGGSTPTLVNLQDSLLRHLLARLEAGRGAARAPNSASASWSCSTSSAALCCARSRAATSAASASPPTAPSSPTRWRRAKSTRRRATSTRLPVAGGKAVQLTKDGISQAPLWGPTGKIVFVKQLGAKKRKYGPKNELYLMNANGTQQKRLTHTNVGPLLTGLIPTEWSANGQRLLAEFGGQDTSYAVTVNPKTGAQKPLDKMGDGEQGFVGTALSSDGTTVLGFHRRLRTRPQPHGRRRSPTAAARPRSWSRTPPNPTGVFSEQADLAQDRDAVGVDVLALDRPSSKGITSIRQ